MPSSGLSIRRRRLENRSNFLRTNKNPDQTVWVFLLISILFFAGTRVRQGTVQAQGEGNQYALALQDFAWNHTTLQVLVVTPGNVSWWKDDFLNASLRAIGQWNEAIAHFALNYSDFAYLSNVRMTPTVSEVEKPGFDIYLNWTSAPLSDVSDEIGLSNVFAYQSSAIVNCTISLAVQSNHGQPLNVVDMQNVALHELGHALGLGHCNYTDDLMYPVYTLWAAPQEVSTLDVYGVAVLFAWENAPSGFYPPSVWLNRTAVTSPAEVTYKYLPVSPQNAAPQSLATNPLIEQLMLIFETLIHPEIFAVVVGFLVICVVLGLLVRKRRRRIRVDS